MIFIKAKNVLVVLPILSILLLIAGLGEKVYMSTNILDSMGRRKTDGFVEVPEVGKPRDYYDFYKDEEFFDYINIDYEKKYLREDIHALYVTSYKSQKDLIICVEKNLECLLPPDDTAKMILYIRYDSDPEKIEYEQVYIGALQGRKILFYYDEETVTEYLEKNDITEEYIAELQRYALYDIVLKTWAEAHSQCYKREKRKIEQLPMVDNTFHFGTGRTWFETWHD